MVKDELTAYAVPDSTKRWMEKFNPANEGLYSTMEDGKVQQDRGYRDWETKTVKPRQQIGRAHV